MKYLKIGLYLLLLVIFIFPFFVLPKILKIKKIECYTQYGICSDQIYGRISNFSGKPLNDVKKGIIKEFSRDQVVQKYSYQLKLPSTLRVNIIIEKPKYAINQKGTKDFILVSSKGIVIDKENISNLPTLIIGDTLPSIGSGVSESQKFALDLVYGFYYLFQVKTGEEIDNSLVFRLSNGIKATFPLEGDVNSLLGSLKLVLSRLNQSEVNSKIGNVREIDLRYKNVILKYE